jgi:hypothetical protein
MVMTSIDQRRNIILEKIISKTTGAIAAAIKGLNDILTAIRTAVKNQVIGVLGDVGNIGSAGLDE